MSAAEKSPPQVRTVQQADLPRRPEGGEAPPWPYHCWSPGGLDPSSSWQEPRVRWRSGIRPEPSECNSPSAPAYRWPSVGSSASILPQGLVVRQQAPQAGPHGPGPLPRPGREQRCIRPGGSPLHLDREADVVKRYQMIDLVGSSYRQCCWSLAVRCQWWPGFASRAGPSHCCLPLHFAGGADLGKHFGSVSGASLGTATGLRASSHGWGYAPAICPGPGFGFCCGYDVAFPLAFRSKKTPSLGTA